MQKIVIVVFTAVVLTCLLSSGAGAQPSSCKVYFDVAVYACGFAPAGNCIAPWPIPAGAVYVGNCGPWCSSYWIWGNKCKRLKPHCQSCPQAQGGRPIDLATGNTFIDQTDISLPGLGGGLTLARRWNSIPSSLYSSGSHMFGLNWQSTYEDRLVFNSGDGFLMEEGSGDDETSFGFSSWGPNTYSIVGPANKTGTLTQDVNSTNVVSFTLTSMNGEKRTYDPTTGALLTITDRNGNKTQLTYDASNRLATVTDPASRHLNFTYQSPTSSLVSTASSDVAITLSYAYDSLGRLTKVTKPDNTTLSFQYDGNNRITAVLDNDGKVLESHTYDAVGRGLTSTRANSVESLTVTY